MFESEMIIGNGCQRNIDNSITLGCRTKEGKKKILAKFNKNVMDGWVWKADEHLLISIFFGLCINTQTPQRERRKH